MTTATAEAPAPAETPPEVNHTAPPAEEAAPAVAETPAESKPDEAPPLTPEEIAELRAQVEALRKTNLELSTKLDQKNQHERRILEADRAVGELEKEITEQKGVLKGLQEEHTKAVNVLRNEISRRSDQLELPLKGDASDKPQATAEEKPAAETVADEKGKTPLTQIGLTSHQAGILAGLDPAVETVAHLERLIAEGGFVPGRIKGLKDTGINKISDKLLAFRQKFPKPGGEKQVPDVNGEHDPSAFHAGQIAKADGKEQSENPHPEKSHQWTSWNAGWAQKNAELGTAPKIEDPERHVNARPPEVIQIPTPENEPTSSSITLQWRVSDGKICTLISVSYPSPEENVDQRVEVVDQQEETPVYFDDRDAAIRHGCQRLVAYWKDALPELGTYVANEIELYLEKLGDPNPSSDAEMAEHAESCREACVEMASKIEDMLEVDGPKRERLCEMLRDADVMLQSITRLGKVTKKDSDLLTRWGMELHSITLERADWKPGKKDKKKKKD